VSERLGEWVRVHFEEKDIYRERKRERKKERNGDRDKVRENV
jgi:hypothetical protein